MIKENRIIKGFSLSSGIAIGPAFLFLSGDISIPKYKIKKQEIPGEIARFKKTVENAKQEILHLEVKADRAIRKEADDLLKAHVQLIEDPILHNETIKELKRTLMNVEYVLDTVLNKIIEKFMKIDDQYIRERVHDIRDIRIRLMKSFLGSDRSPLDRIDKPVILVANDLFASDTVKMDKRNILGIITEKIEETSHTAILAKSYGIPTLVNVKNATKLIDNNDYIIADCITGKVVAQPDVMTLKVYKSVRDYLIEQQKKLTHLRNKSVHTRDKRTIHIGANIETLEEVDVALKNGAENIGLLRTEFLFLSKNYYHDEEAQFNEYKEIVQKMKGASVVIRTIDVGGDKFFLDEQKAPLDPTFMPEANPFLGCRAIRFSLCNTNEFRKQLRAILRASVFGTVKLLFPMISGEEELDSAIRQVNMAKTQLDRDGIEYKDIEIGILVEVPSAALIMDRLIHKVDFISIGTNDLIQYTIAVDRTNSIISYLYEPYHPSIIKLIKRIIDITHDNGKKVTVCGEIGGDIAYTVLLVGLGVDNLSMSSSSILKMKKFISNLVYSEARDIAGKAFSIGGARKIKQLVDDYIVSH
ncbi:phosphoenolpyruvate--protein phosphotransferase, partial [Spirochaetota bacterium]